MRTGEEIMTHLAYFPVYGHALCPHCEAEFDLAQAAPTFGERFRKEVILYVMCPSCASHFNRRGPHTQKKMMNKCFCNVKLRQLNPDGSQIPWAVTIFYPSNNSWKPCVSHRKRHRADTRTLPRADQRHTDSCHVARWHFAI